MAKSVVVNKLNLGKETLGYRFDILENYEKLISLDVSKEYVNYMLKIIGKDNIKKGVIIQGNIVNGLFITSNEEKVVEVTNKKQAESILEKYFYSSDKEINEVLDGVNSTKEGLMESKITGHIDTLENTQFAKFKVIKDDYNTVLKCAKGFKCNINVFEDQDDYGGSLRIPVSFSNPIDALKYSYKLDKALGLKESRINLAKVKEGSGYTDFMFPLSEPVEKFIDAVKNAIGSLDDLEGNLSNRYVSTGDAYVVGYERGIPGYDELEYAEEKEDVYKRYNLL